MFTVDASVYVSAMNSGEAASQQSYAFLEKLHAGRHAIYSPTLLLVEVAAAISRALGDAQQAIDLTQSIRDLPGHVWIVLDAGFAEASLRLAANSRLRGADAIYAAVAMRHKAALVTRDRQQIKRLRPFLTVMVPEEAIELLV